MPPRYFYSLVDNTYVTRQALNKTERLTAEGVWVEHNDLWDVMHNGRSLANDEEALRAWERLREWDRRHAEEQ